MSAGPERLSRAPSRAPPGDLDALAGSWSAAGIKIAEPDVVPTAEPDVVPTATRENAPPPGVGKRGVVGV